MWKNEKYCNIEKCSATQLALQHRQNTDEQNANITIPMDT
jgi:hypothetical protein